MRFTLGVLVGAAVGAGTALLLAPHDGATNRQWLRNKTDELAAGESLAGALVRGAREALEVPRERIRLALEAGRQAADRREAALWQEL
ncbi:MAG TPA: hypothetical protein VER55_03995, partial [Ardenticatenaceae bacterium]|nr:hypothetical protein [Ardenticatenaceae bacterium]